MPLIFYTMNCLNDITCGKRTIIGIRDFVSCVTPESGLFIQDLPGVKLKAAARITDEMRQTGVEVLEHSVRMATKHVFDEFTTEISKYFDFNAIVETRQIDNFTNETLAPANLDRGIILKRWRSELAKIYIEEVYINCANSGVVNLKVQEVKTFSDGSIQVNKETIYEVDVLENTVMSVPLRYKAESEEVIICFNQTDFETKNCSFTSGSNGGGCGTCGGGSSKNFYVSGWNGTKQVNGCFGVGVLANVRCYEESVICQILPRMYFLLWYKAGIVFLNEFLNSDRINGIVTFGKEEAEKNLETLTKEYNTKFKTVVKGAYNFLRTTKGECITCNGNTYVQTHP